MSFLTLYLWLCLLGEARSARLELELVEGLDGVVRLVPRAVKVLPVIRDAAEVLHIAGWVCELIDNAIHHYFKTCIKKPIYTALSLYGILNTLVWLGLYYLETQIIVF